MSDYEIQNSDAAETVAKVLRLTRQDTLAWEATADPDTLIAPFKGEYVFQLSHFDDPGPENAGGYSLSVLKGRRALMSFGSRDLSKDRDLRIVVDPGLGAGINAYATLLGYFEELWKRAFYRANRVPEEFERVNKLLDSELVAASH
jgi:hypothetical protein